MLFSNNLTATTYYARFYNEKFESFKIKMTYENKAFPEKRKSW
jgi:hypothetical protein